MEEEMRALWNDLARIWGAGVQLRTELFSGRDVLQKQRKRKKDNYALTVCQELTAGADQYLTWIVVEPTKDLPISLDLPDVWSGLSSHDYILAIEQDGEVTIGKASVISGMPTSLYPAWRQTDELLNGRLAELLKEKSPRLFEKLKPA